MPSVFGGTPRIFIKFESIFKLKIPLLWYTSPCIKIGNVRVCSISCFCVTNPHSLHKSPYTHFFVPPLTCSSNCHCSAPRSSLRRRSFSFYPPSTQRFPLYCITCGISRLLLPNHLSVTDATLVIESFPFLKQLYFFYPLLSGAISRSIIICLVHFDSGKFDST